jgi:1,2-diacylglycerol-3-alpha-glucose alpha-1,2-galactosyltransferase
MSVLEAFATHTPVMVRKLQLYDQIIEPYAIEATDIDDMEANIRQLRANPAGLAKYAQLSADATAEYSEEHLAAVWRQFYEEQAELAHQTGKKTAGQ